GVYRRAFRLVAGAGRVVADMEDDFHRFRVTLAHDGARVTQVRAEAFRYPWSECPGATAPLRALEGMPLSARPLAASKHADPRANCTHLFDIAALAVAHAAAKRERRRYEIEIPDRREGRTRARLARDGEPLLDWELEGTDVVSPPPFTGRTLRGGSFLLWAERSLDADAAEAAIALRRACFISVGRARDLDAAHDAGVYLSWAPGSCHTMTDGVAQRALRVRGATLEFTSRADLLLSDID
ncbi:MAG TPA: DUF2889 domain-containing protein, partial [Myxococcota bacterium]|nr:DUF2889 domain-containing protein [Myxococcota bacterium]